MGEEDTGIAAVYKERMKEDSKANGRRRYRKSSRLKGENERGLRSKREKQLSE
jgi:hypothetical protein